MAVELPQRLRRDRPLSAETEAFLSEVTNRRSKRGRAAGKSPAALVEKKTGVPREIKYYRGELDNVTHKTDVLSCDLPIFALRSTDKVRVYERDGVQVMIKPDVVDGCATVMDKALWIYCVGQMVAALNQGATGVSRYVEIDVQDFLKKTGKEAYTRGVEKLKVSLQRLKGTTIKTNVYSAKIRKEEAFGLLDEYQYIEAPNGEITGLRVVLPDWVWRSIEKLEVLSIPPGYFNLRKTLERRLFEIGRKHVGSKLKWPISLEVLKDKCGSVGELKEFKRQVKAIVSEHYGHETFPTFILTLDEGSNVLTFHQKKIKVRAKK